MTHAISKKRVILVTGPPNNGREEYILAALPDLQKVGKVGYYHVFDYMQRLARSCGIPNLTREKVFEVAKSKLDEIRDKSFFQVVKDVRSSTNDIDIISTPAVFKTPIRADYYTGVVEGLTLEIIKALKPNLIILFIDDLIKVRAKVAIDPLRRKLGFTLKDLAEWRELSLQIVKDYVIQAKASGSSVEFMIFAKEHPASTFVDLVLGIKPRIYVSYHITGQDDFKDVQRLISKMKAAFVCMDPYAIKDWQIVKEYDKAISENKMVVTLDSVDINSSTVTETLPLDETEEAINLIRSQIVERDLEVIANVHATVVYHISTQPSYGVMVEVFHSITIVQRPVYVLYPFKVRLSPFFEHYINPENMIQGDTPRPTLEDQLVTKLIEEYKSWPTWTPF